MERRNRVLIREDDMALKYFFLKRRPKKPRGQGVAVNKKILLSQGLKESPEPESPDTAETFFTEQETTKKLGSAHKQSRRSQRSPSIFII